MRTSKKVNKRRQTRAWRVRNAIRGSSTRPRLSVFRSNKHIYAQIIDDNCGQSLVAASTSEKVLSEAITNGGNKAAATRIGQALAERALQKGIKQVAFDRGPYRYHGRIAALADAARAAGLDF